MVRGEDVAALVSVGARRSHAVDLVNAAGMINVAAVTAIVAFLQVIVAVGLEQCDAIMLVVAGPARLSRITLIRIAALGLIDVPDAQPALRHYAFESDRLAVFDQQVFAGRKIEVDAIGLWRKLGLINRIVAGR